MQRTKRLQKPGVSEMIDRSSLRTSHNYCPARSQKLNAVCLATMQRVNARLDTQFGQEQT